MQLKPLTPAGIWFAVLPIALAAAAPTLTPGVWTNLNPPGLTFADVCCGGTSFTQGLAIDPTNPAILYVTTSNFNYTADGLYKSTDAGAHWSRIGKLTNPLFQGADTMITEGIRIRVDPKNGQHLYCGDGVRGSSIGFWVSNDGGATFTMPAAFKAFNALDVYNIAADPSDFNHVLVTFHSGFPGLNDAGVLESTDGGTSWVPHQPVAGWGAGHSIAFLNNSTTWLLGTQGDGYWRTTNGGSSWNSVSSENIAHGGGEVYYAKTGVVYATSGNKILRSTDNGASWAEVSNGATFCNGVYGDGTTLYTHMAYGSSTPLPWYTSPETDGENWTAQPSMGTSSSGPFEMAFDAANRILYSASWGDGFLALKLPATAVEHGRRTLSPAAGLGRAFAVTSDRLVLPADVAMHARAVDLYNLSGALIGQAAVGPGGVVAFDRGSGGRQIAIARIR